MLYTEEKLPFWKRLLFSSFLLNKNTNHKIAYVAVIASFSILSNLIEIKFLETQFSFTITISVLAGVFLGVGSGFAACVIGDFIGVLLRGWQYQFWVGLSTGMFAVLGGLIFDLWKSRGKAFLFVKIALVCILTFLICTIGINSTGYYFYNKFMGFSDALLQYVSQEFGVGEDVTFLIYVAYRLFFKLQILNSLFNYVLLFIAIPALQKIKPLGLNL